MSKGMFKTKRLFVREIKARTVVPKCPNCQRECARLLQVGEYINARWNNIFESPHCEADDCIGFNLRQLWKMFRGRFGDEFTAIEISGYQGTRVGPMLTAVQDELNMLRRSEVLYPTEPLNDMKLRRWAKSFGLQCTHGSDVGLIDVWNGSAKLAVFKIGDKGLFTRVPDAPVTEVK